ncbi:MAG: GH32 C-terminal domain-containing protein [Planctomycetes bacterium]|nr:GH32 C-terminal domain-containing protein [Planctomycetota bacterium]
MKALVSLVIVLAASAIAAASEDIVIADFEGKDYGGWKVTGDAFGAGPAKGTLAGQMRVSGYMGKGLVNSFHDRDKSTGTLTSPPLKIQRRYICFLIGGGGYAGQTCINLLVGGKVVRTATGPNVRPGGSERLDWQSWDVGDLLGREAVIQIVDARTKGWGHINIDQIIQSDTIRKAKVRRPARPGETHPGAPASREIAIQKRYLHLPVRNGAKRCRMKVSVGEKVIDEFNIALDADKPDFWVFLDVGAYKGRTARIEADRLPVGSAALEAIRQGDQVPGADRLYKEKLRQQFHFSSRRGWNNDCNGLVYYKGEWHMYYQHNPYGWRWGNMHWGHAVSRDLVHWTELPIAIYPHRYGDWVFSGSAVVDANNTAGFKTGADDVIVAAYTSTGRGECIAYSNDRGRSFTDYEHNPVVKHHGRDPKVIWYGPGKHWVMAVFDERDRSRGIAFYTSPDLKHWQYASRIVGFFECPEIFEMPVAGSKTERRWVAYAANGEYSVGRFDGRTFTPDRPGKQRYSYGNCFYASQTWNNVPPSDGRRIQIAWGRIATPGMPFNQCMLFPVELTLHKTPDGMRLFAVPVREIALLHARRHQWRDLPIPRGDHPLKDVRCELLHVRCELAVGTAKQVGLNVRGCPVTYDADKQQLTCRKCRAPLKTIDGKIRLEILVDRNSVEVYANDGRIYMPVGGILPADNLSVSLFSSGGDAKAASLDVYELKSAWQ